MMSREPSEFVPKLRHVVYWEQKEQFMYDVDQAQDWTIFAAVAGKFSYRFGEEAGTAGFGDWIICPPRVDLQRKVLEPLSFFVIHFSWSCLEGKGGNMEEPLFLAGKISIRNTGRLLSNYNMMRKAETLNPARKLQQQTHYATDIWFTHCKESGQEIWSADRINASPPEPLMERAAALIQQHADEPFEMKEIASEVGISPVRFTQRFKVSFGVTPIQYLTNLRMEKAKSLLVETDLTLEAISEKVGYRNGYYLNRLFRKQLDMTPAMYRRTHRV